MGRSQDRSELAGFHPAVAGWFAGRFGTPTEPQSLAWPSIRAGRHTLIAAPTGSGKTLAAFLAAIDALVRRSARGPLPDAVDVVYVSPLKALSNDIHVNLEQPLAGIDRELRAAGRADSGIRTLVRTGDTPSKERARMTRRPPHILVTTPESLYILLTSDGGRAMLRTARTVIVDEIHAVAGNRRGTHLALSLERLAALVRDATGAAPTRIGLSATQRPIEEIARFLVGTADGPDPDCAIVDTGHRRGLDLALELPRSPLEAVMAAEVWDEVYDRLAELIREHRTTLVFVPTRRLAERAARHLEQRLGEEHVAAHHGSLARERRLDAEQRLKAGTLRALVATASLELGIDVGGVDLVCNLGSTRSIATLVQRVGRSAHHREGTPKGRLFPTSRDELVECAALLDSVRRGELDRIRVPERALDVLAQQVVACVACEEWREDELFALVRRAHPYRVLARGEFDAVLEMLAGGFATRRGRRGALVHRDEVHGRLRGRRGARLAAITSGGAIPDAADYRVVLQPGDTFVGTVDEDFAIESMAGDVFQLGNTSWRILRIDQGRVLVEDARGQAPTIPFWFGEAPGRSAELSASVARLRVELGRRLEDSREAAIAWLVEEVGIDRVAAEQAVDYLAAARATLGTLPSQQEVVLERFFDDVGDQHLVIHAPFGSRVNRAWGLALRKRFCRQFNFELQAAATDDAILLSLGPTHSFPAEETFAYLRAATVRALLVQALLDAPMFPIRWRWNAGRSLALPRWSGGRRVPPRLQRMRAEDLIAVVFPDQLACLENVAGDREVPDHPLVEQTVRDCLEEAMDVDALERALDGIASGAIRTSARELREPSPLAHEILNARPYAFLDDAPLEERRAQAVRTRRWLDPESAAELGRLDPAAIDRVCREVAPDPASPDELHDALVTSGFLGEDELREAWRPHAESLAGERRAALLVPEPGRPGLWVAAERVAELRAVHPAAELRPPIAPPPRLAGREWSPEAALIEIVRGRLSASGPATAGALAAACRVRPVAIAAALAALEAEGYAMRGAFRGAEPEWCERGLLARIHRSTLDRLRREIEPVDPASFLRFLLDWQRVDPAARASGAASLPALLEQLEGFAAPAAAWESEILPARVEGYDPEWLDALCLSGRVVWGRPATSGKLAARPRPVSGTPIVVVPRAHRGGWLPGSAERGGLSPDAAAVLERLARGGACFFDDLVQASGLLRTRVEIALGELVGRGLVTADSFTGLRALITPSDRRPAIAGRGRRSRAVYGTEHAGRWSLLAPAEPVAADGNRDGPVEAAARALLRRYGVVGRRLLLREDLAPPWRELLPVYRRWEARGEIRGGRFVDSLTGEQFALPEAVGRLRRVRRETPREATFSVSAADPVNLLGTVLPGPRVPAVTGNRILFRDGLPLAIRAGGEITYLAELGPAEQWEARAALLRRRVPPRLGAWLGRPLARRARVPRGAPEPDPATLAREDPPRDRSPRPGAGDR